jgi:hypothetical protein
MSNLGSVPVITAQQQGLGVYNTGTPAPAPVTTPVQGTANTVTVSQPKVTSTSTAAPLGSTALSTQLAQQAQAAGVQNVPQSLLSPQTVTTAPTTATQPTATVSQPTITQTQNPNIGSTTNTSGTPVTYSGLVGGLASTSAAGSPTAATAGSGLLTSGNTNSLTASPFYQQAQTAEGQLEGLQSNLATYGGNLATSGQSLPTIVGEKGAEQAALGGQEQALATQVQNDLQAAGLATTQQATQQNALTSAGSIGNTAQSTAQSGLASAATSAAPTGSFPFSYNPLTGTFSSGAAGTTAAAGSIGMTGTYSTDVANATQAISKNPSLYNGELAALTGYYGATAVGQLNQALTNAGLNPTTIAAQSDAAAQSTVTAGTAVANANASAVAGLTQNVANLSAARDSVSGLSNQLISYLGANNGLNPSNINAINGVAQTIAANTSNPQYQTLQNLMTDIAGKYSSILVPGGASTDYTTGLSQGMINQLAQGSTIQQVISGLDQQAQATIAGQQKALSNTETGTNPNPTSPLVGQTVTAPDGTQIIITN